MIVAQSRPLLPTDITIVTSQGNVDHTRVHLTPHLLINKGRPPPGSMGLTANTVPQQEGHPAAHQIGHQESRQVVDHVTVLDGETVEKETFTDQNIDYTFCAPFFLFLLSLLLC